MQEVVLTLEGCRRDFAALIQRIKLQKAFESSDAESRSVELGPQHNVNRRKLH